MANASQLVKGWSYLEVNNIEIKHAQTVVPKIRK